MQFFLRGLSPLTALPPLLSGQVLRRVPAQSRMWVELLLPASTECLVELDQRDQLIALSLSESELCGKRIRVVGKHLEVVRGACFEPHFGQSSCILRGLEQLLLLNPELAVFAVCNQGI